MIVFFCIQLYLAISNSPKKTIDNIVVISKFAIVLQAPTSLNLGQVSDLTI